MAHSKKEDWQKDLRKALESFDADWEKQVKKADINRYNQIQLLNNSSKKSEWSAKGGAKGSQICIQNKLGIHIDDEELRSEWARLGGYAVIDEMNQKNKESGHWERLAEEKKGVPRDEETKKKLYETSKHSWRAILQFDKKGNFIKEWENLAIIERETGMAKSNIGNCCRGTNGVRNVNSAYGFVWKYKEGDV